MMNSALRVRLAAAAALLSIAAASLSPAPAYALFGLGDIVYDPSNFAQNVLTAARTLEQISNQIRMLHNQATSLINEARNLQNLPLSLLGPLQTQIRQTQRLLNDAGRIAYDVREIERVFADQYKTPDLSVSEGLLVAGAEARWQNSVAAFEDALKVQAGAVGNIEGARAAIDSLVTASQSASGALQAAQAGNQLLAVQSQQLADLTATMAAIGRAQALDAANAATAKVQAREQLRRFLTPGAAYVPSTVTLFRD